MIFYLDTLNVHPSFEGLVSAPYDQSTAAPWGDYGLLVFEGGGAMGVAIGTGRTNTMNIIDSGFWEVDDAAITCDELYLNGFSDWFLPSKDELNEMNQKIGHEASFPNVNIAGFQLAPYHSSTEEDDYNAWAHDFFYNVQFIESKNSSLHVRAIRDF